MRAVEMWNEDSAILIACSSEELDVHYSVANNDLLLAISRMANRRSTVLIATLIFR